MGFIKKIEIGILALSVVGASAFASPNQAKIFHGHLINQKESENNVTY